MMIVSKKLPLAVSVLGLGAMAASAEIKITDNFSTTGFVDMSANGMAPSEGDATLNAALDQYEMDFMYKFGYFSARADVNAIGPSGSVTIEQGFITAALTPELNLSVGKFLSASGFEAAEPTGLYQYSTSKLLTGYAGPTYGGYENGLNLAYTTPKFGVYGAVVTSVWGSDVDLLTPGFEAQFSLTPVEGVTAKVTFLHEMYDDSTDHDSQSEVNAWAQYSKGSITVAGEYSQLINWGPTEQMGMGWLAMANIKFTDKLAATVRYSGIMLEDADDPDTEITFSPSFAISPNWLVLAEGRFEIDGTDTEKGISYAAESTFSF
jgi:Putative beta-barrel porin-2, OmpL-like. bbp2